MGGCFVIRDTSLNETEWINHCCSSLRVILESLNNKIIHEDIPGHIRTVTHNIVSTVRYERIDDKGPHLGYLSKEHPLVNRYVYVNKSGCKNYFTTTGCNLYPADDLLKLNLTFQSTPRTLKSYLHLHFSAVIVDAIFFF